MIPDDLRYTSEHEWIRVIDQQRARIGITDYAQEALGDVVFVNLPDVGASVSAGDSMGEVESTKSVSEIYAPLTGEVLLRNEELLGRPELVNTDPYGDGWIVEVRVDDPDQVAGLLEPAAYDALVEHK